MMPYNNAPISPPEEITGTSSLPLARVKKIIAMDEDIAQCSNSAAFAISVATEIFIRYLTEQAYNVVKAERKPRRNIAYKDIATAVARVDNLEFLSDVIPKTTTYRQYKEKRAREEAAAAAESAPTGPHLGQTTLQNGINGQLGFHGGSHNIKPEGLDRNGVVGGSSSGPISLVNGSPLADRTVISSMHSHPGVQDVEMRD